MTAVVGRIAEHAGVEHCPNAVAENSEYTTSMNKLQLVQDFNADSSKGLRDLLIGMVLVVGAIVGLGILIGMVI